MNKTLIINRSQCEQILSVEKCIPYMKDALIAISEKNTTILQRTMIPHENGNKLANMPASLNPMDVTGAKVIIFPGMETAKAGTNQGIIPLFRISTGELKAIVDAELITVVRTAATSGAATEVLAKKDAQTVAIIGCGKQGKAHVQAMLNVRDIKKVYMWDINLQAATDACELMKKEYPAVDFIPCQKAKDAVADADIVCTCTYGRGTEPVISYSMLKAGCHINAVGACSAMGREVDAAIIKNSTIFTDWDDAVKRDAGDILVALNNGEIDEMPPLTEIGKVLNGSMQGRQSDEEITMFESVGISVEDIAAANMIYEYAVEHGIGTYLEI